MKTASVGKKILRTIIIVIVASVILFTVTAGVLLHRTKFSVSGWVDEAQDVVPTVDVTYGTQMGRC